MSCHVSWQNDICSFRVVNVALRVSFKLISFVHLFDYMSTVCIIFGIFDYALAV